MATDSNDPELHNLQLNHKQLQIVLVALSYARSNADDINSALECRPGGTLLCHGWHINRLREEAVEAVLAVVDATL